MTIITPFPYQRDCLERLEETRRQDITRALVVMATGLGKTVVAALDAKEVVEKKSWRVLYLAHQNEILEQARATFEEVLGDKATYGYFHGAAKTDEKVTCLFASFQTMASWRETFDADEFDYVIVDESHHSHAETYLPTIKYFKPKFLLAITATPDRKDLRNIRELYGNEVFSITLEEALAKGYLTPIQYLLLIDEVQSQQVIKTSSGKLSIKELNRRLFVPLRDEKIVDTILEKIEGVENPRTLIFCSSIRHCENIAKLMPNAAALHSKVASTDRGKRLAAFKSGAISTLVTVDQFNEGIDLPAANVIAFLRSTSSRTIFLQQLGRGLRRAEGKAFVLVLDFVGNCERMEKVAELANNVHRLREEFDSPDATSDEGVPRDSFVVDHEGEFHFTEHVQDVLSFIGEVRTGYNKKTLLDQLRNLRAELGRQPTSKDIKEASKEGKIASTATFKVYFGSLAEAFRQAGFGSVRTYGLTDEQALDYLKVLAKELGHVPNQEDIQQAHREGKGPSSSLYYERYGKLNTALEMAGLSPRSPRNIPLERILEQLRALALELGRTPTSADAKRACREGKIVSDGTIRKGFGTYSAALKAAGLSEPSSNLYSNEELTESLRRLADSLGRVPTNRDAVSASKAGTCPYPEVYRKRFGSWAAALEAAGIK